MLKRNWFIPLLAVAAFVLSACNLPSASATPTEESANVVFTAAAQTVEANLTQAAVLNPPTLPVVPTSTQVVPTSTLASAPTLAAPTTVPTQECNKAQFVTDVTIPDGTTLDPDEDFTKTWRLKNIGTCSWTTSYAVVFDSGASMDGPAVQALTGNVNPGQTLDISIDLKAPATAGDYTGYWKLRDGSGKTFSQFYVQIKVGGSGPFAVTSVSYTLSTWGDAGHTDCPRVIANITTNGAGTVTYKWTRKDVPDGGALQSITFDSAGTKTVNYDWARGSTWDGTETWVGIYVDDPNHQDFGKTNFTTACTSP